MLNKNSRAIKVLTLCLIFTLVFSFNMAFANTVDSGDSPGITLQGEAADSSGSGEGGDQGNNQGDSNDQGISDEQGISEEGDGDSGTGDEEQTEELTPVFGERIFAPILMKGPGPFTGNIKTTDKAGNEVNENAYNSRQDVHLKGYGFKANSKLWVRVTNPGGTPLGTSSSAVITVNGSGNFGPISLWDAVGGYDYSKNGYKAWVSPSNTFQPNNTDNFSVVSGKGTIQITKVDQDEQAQANVRFNLDTKDKGKYKSFKNGTTNAAGILTFANLNPGDYYLSEVVPGGYTSDLSPYTKITVDKEGIQNIPVNVVNTMTVAPPSTGAIQINKSYSPALGEEGTAPVATFRLFTKAGDDYTQTGSDLAITGATSGTFSNLEYGTYYLKEVPLTGYTLSIAGITASADGYYEIVVDSTTAIVLAAVNTENGTPPPSMGSIQINKTYSPALVEEETAPVAIFGLYIKEEGEYLPSRSNLTITGEDSATFSDVSFGTYYLKEKAPEGYTLSITDMTANDDGYYEIVVDSTTAIVLAAVNTEGSTPPPTTGKIIINKTYQYNDNGETPVYRVMDVPVAYFDLYELFGDYAVVTQGIAGEGTLEFDNLAPGEYCLHERAPEGFNPYFNGTAVGNNGCYGITIQAGGEITVNVVNAGYGQEPVFGSVEITKLNQRGLPWDGKSVKFTLYIKSGETDKYVEYLSGNTDVSAENKGKLVFEGLDISKTYYLSEQVPQGYRSSLGAYTLVVFNEDHIALFEVTNRKVSSGGGSGPGSDPEEPITPTPEEPVLTPPEEPVVIPEEPEVFTPPAGELPKTGGNTAGYLLSGSTLAALGILLRRFQR